MRRRYQYGSICLEFVKNGVMSFFPWILNWRKEKMMKRYPKVLFFNAETNVNGKLGTVEGAVRIEDEQDFKIDLKRATAQAKFINVTIQKYIENIYSAFTPESNFMFQIEDHCLIWYYCDDMQGSGRPTVLGFATLKDTGFSRALILMLLREMKGLNKNDPALSRMVEFSSGESDKGKGCSGSSEDVTVTPTKPAGAVRQRQASSRKNATQQYEGLLKEDGEESESDEEYQTFVGAEEVSDSEEEGEGEDEDDEEEGEEEEEREDDGEEGEVDLNEGEPGHHSGSTAVVANAGDSRCVVCHEGKALEMRFDNKPEDESELNRITKTGGKVACDGRVNGGLNLSRAIAPEKRFPKVVLTRCQRQASQTESRVVKSSGRVPSKLQPVVLLNRLPGEIDCVAGSSKQRNDCQQYERPQTRAEVRRLLRRK